MINASDDLESLLKQTSGRPKIGILTSGGDCPGLNAVLRAATKTAFWLGYEMIGIMQGFEGLCDPLRCVRLTPSNTADILNLGGTILGSANKGRFGGRVGIDGRTVLADDLIDQVRGTFQQLDLQGLIVVGGDGSLSTALQFHESGLPVVGVPKTIDNDLSLTAFTFGFNSAVLCCADALGRLHTTGSSHSRVMVLEVMGRHTGWNRSARWHRWGRGRDPDSRDWLELRKRHREDQRTSFDRKALHIDLRGRGRIPARRRTGHRRCGASRIGAAAGQVRWHRPHRDRRTEPAD